MNRKDAVRIIIEHIPDDALVVSANGYISRELHSQKGRPGNFYMLGSMGMGLPIALGLSLGAKNRKVVVLDGDGNLIMNMGSLSTVSKLQPKNLLHIVLDNGMYESTGGQPSSSNYFSFNSVAKSFGYRRVRKADSEKSLKRALKEVYFHKGPAFLHVKINEKSDPAERVSLSPAEIVERFSAAIKPKSGGILCEN